MMMIANISDKINREFHVLPRWMSHNKDDGRSNN